MKISFVRGAYLNNFEGQNYALPITGYSSLFPLDSHVPFPLIKLPSLADLQKIPLLDKPIKYIANRTLGDSQILWGLEAYLQDADIVHIADPHYYYAYQAARMKAAGRIKKLVSTWWETIAFNNEGTVAKKKIKKYVMSQVDSFICYTHAAKKCLLEEGIMPEKIRVIPLGIDLDQFYPQKNKPDVFTVLFVGRLVKEKGILDLYEAFRRITETNKDVRLNVIGDGPLESTLRSYIERDGLKEVVSIDRKSYKEMPDVYRQAHVLCVPSKKTPTWEEQYGMVFIEAMASGLPIVSYDTGAIGEVVEKAGIILKENDMAGIQASLIKIRVTKELGGKIGTIGRERAKALFDAAKTGKEIYEFYKSLSGHI